MIATTGMMGQPHFVECDEAGCGGSTDVFETKEEAIVAWNRRTPSSTVAGAQEKTLEKTEADVNAGDATRQKENYPEVVSKIFACSIVKRVPKEGAWDTACPFCFAENVGAVRHKPDCVVPLAKKILLL